LRRSQRTESPPSLDAQRLLDHLRITREPILHVKPFVGTLTPREMDLVIGELRLNTHVEVVYLQNLGTGIQDAQLRRLVDEVLRQRRIWAMNIGETDAVSTAGWQYLLDSLPNTALGYLYIGEKSIDASMKRQFIEALRANRRRDENGAQRDPSVARHVTHMWWNPKNARSFKE
jgi:hypothetical protein